MIQGYQATEKKDVQELIVGAMPRRANERFEHGRRYSCKRRVTTYLSMIRKERLQQLDINTASVQALRASCPALLPTREY